MSIRIVIYISTYFQENNEEKFFILTFSCGRDAGRMRWLIRQEYEYELTFVSFLISGFPIRKENAVLFAE